jgi:hypothetical protein
MLEGYPLEIALTACNSAAQAWYGYEQVSPLCRRDTLIGYHETNLKSYRES